MEKVFIYARQSKGESLDRSESVEMQIAKCTTYCKEKGYEVIGIKFDANNSGKAYPNTNEAKEQAKTDIKYIEWKTSTKYDRRKRYRKGLGEIIDDLHKVDGIVVYDKTRLMRPITNSMLAPFIIQTFKNKKIISVLDGGVIDYNDFAQNLAFTIQDITYHKWIADCATKSKAETKKLKDSGYLNCRGEMLGFKQVGKHKVVIDENEMQEVKYIINAVNNGIAYQEIIRNLSREKRILTYKHIHSICNRVEYSGYTHDSNGNLIESKVYPCVIPLADIIKAQSRVNNKKILNRDKKSVHPLSGIVKCGYCHKTLRIQRFSPMTNSNEKGKLFNYVCIVGRDLQNDYCRKSSIREYYGGIDKKGIIDGVLPFIYTYLVERIKPTDTSDRIAVIDNELQRIDKAIDFIVTQVEMDLISKEKGIEKTREYAEKRKSLSEEKTMLISANGNNIENAEEIARGIIENGFIDKNIYKQIAKDVFKEILVYEDRIEVVLNSGETAIIERYRDMNIRCIPNYTIVENGGKRIITYQYKSFVKKGDTTLKTILKKDDYIVQSIGTNPKLHELVLKRQEKHLKRVHKANLVA